MGSYIIVIKIDISIGSSLKFIKSFFLLSLFLIRTLRMKEYICAYILSFKQPCITKAMNGLACLGDVISLSTIFIALYAFEVGTSVSKYYAIIIIFFGNIFFLFSYVFLMFPIYKKKLGTLFKFMPGFENKFRKWLDFKTGFVTDLSTDGKTFSKRNLDPLKKSEFFNSKFEDINDLNVKVIHIK